MVMVEEELHNLRTWQYPELVSYPILSLSVWLIYVHNNSTALVLTCNLVILIAWYTVLQRTDINWKQKTNSIDMICNDFQNLFFNKNQLRTESGADFPYIFFLNKAENMNLSVHILYATTTIVELYL